MARRNSAYPGANPFRQAINCIGSLLFERGLRGDLDISVSTRRLGETTTITVYYPDSVKSFTFTDEEVERDMTPRQREARRLQRAGGEDND